jgi:hypothetical protein
VNENPLASMQPIKQSLSFNHGNFQALPLSVMQKQTASNYQNIPVGLTPSTFDSLDEQ